MTAAFFGASLSVGTPHTPGNLVTRVKAEDLSKDSAKVVCQGCKGAHSVKYYLLAVYSPQYVSFY
jgi:hypothetical protein